MTTANPRLGESSPLESKLIQAALSDPLISSPGYSSSRLFALISVLLASPSSNKMDLVKRLKCCYLFKVEHDDTGEIETWWVDMKQKGRVGKGSKSPIKPDVIITIRDKDLLALATGQAQPQKLFAAKRIRVKGNLDKALNVERILSHERDRLETLAPGSKLDEGRPKKERGRWANMKNAVKSKL